MDREATYRPPGNSAPLLVSEWLLLSLIALLPLMKPAVRYPVIAADLLFPLLLAALAMEVASGRRQLRWHHLFAVLLAYVLSLAPSLLATTDVGQSAFKLSTELYLVGLAAATMLIVRNEDMLRRATQVWLAVTAAIVALAIASLAAFAIDPAGPLYQYSRFGFGTLPPGHYPRLALTFFNANMACNYLTVSSGLVFLARDKQWLPQRWAWLLLAGIIVAALSTISPGLGGIALALGTGFWIRGRSRIALAGAVGLAIAATIALAVTPIVHPTAPFLIHIPGTHWLLAPSGRFLVWSATLKEFAAHPLLGHGIGLEPVDVRYVDPSGNLQQLTDAHNVFLSIGAQAGVIGLAGLTLLIIYATRLIAAGKAASTILGLTFLNAFFYQGLGGSFEDARHLWVLFGLVAATASLDFTPADGNNRRAGAPSPG